MEQNLFKKIEEKWQKRWEKNKIFNASKNTRKPKFYVLEMFPYPSGSGLHMGHAFNYTVGDIFARFKRMQGYNVLYPMGYDSFGLPAENAAIKEKIHPKKYTEEAIKNFIRQQKELGFSYDWSRVLATHMPDYYKWNQFFFLKLFEKGLIYRKKAPVNFCSNCNTVLANEQVHQGKCWRHKDTDVEIKHLEQWFIKITDYAEELLNDIENLDWPEKIKVMQKNWIGKSDGVEIFFEVNGEKWPIFTTRPDTIFGVTFMVISSQHPRLMELVTLNQKKFVDNFLKKIKSVSKKERAEEFEKEGVFTGSYALHPFTKEKIPIYTGNFVLADYGSGMVMAVPAHDQRDFEFAKKYKLPIKVVINPISIKLSTNLKEAYVGDGILINSKEFDGLYSEEAKRHVLIALSEKGLARKKIQYKIRDWLVSRQRYWGTPIPIIYCDFCGIVSVPEKDLPILLPEKVKFGKGNPLETNKKFIEAKCPNCGRKARRETDTMDTFFDSSWYYLRYTDSSNKMAPFDKDKVNYWLPVDQYIGGAEHATMHLIYARFFTKALRDLGFLKFDEPFSKLFNQGMIHGEDGFVMSKSRGNIVDPITISKNYGVDALRIFLVSMASPEKDMQWSSQGIKSYNKFLKKIYSYMLSIKISKNYKIDERTESRLNKIIKDVTKHIERFEYNLALIKIRELFYLIPKEANKDLVESFLRLLHPFCPHVTEEIWEKIGNKPFLSVQEWPKFDDSMINEKFEQEEKIVNNIINDVNNVIRLIKDKGGNVKKLYMYVLPNEKNVYDEKLNEIEKRTGLKTKIFSINEKNKYDPQEKSKKARPEKPGIYLE